MQQLLPNIESISSLESKTTLFYFFKFKKGEIDGSDIQKGFAQHQAKCLHWFNCEYTFIGEGDDQWSHAAIFEFPDFKTLEQAVRKGIGSAGIEAVQGFAVRPTSVPSFIIFLFKLLRPIGTLISRSTGKISAEDVLEMMESEGGISPTKKQVIRHLQNTRSSKAYMINLLQPYDKAQYANGHSDVSGATAYNKRYGVPALRSVIMQGGNLIVSGRMGKPFLEINAPKATQGAWSGMAIMEYPNPSRLQLLEKMPGYKKALVHRRAGLERTALIISKK